MSSSTLDKQWVSSSTFHFFFYFSSTILMTGTENTKELNSADLALKRTRLASVRTEFALMRTGFSVASFGAGVTQLIGRNTGLAG